MRELNGRQLETLGERRIASVATINPDGTPHVTSVWFLFEESTVYLAIPSSSTKGRNLALNSRIAVMIDVRENYRESGITAIGEAEIVSDETAASIVQRLHEKYLTEEAINDPSVGPLFAAMDDIAVRLKPTRWVSWDMAELDQQVFGGKLMSKRYFKEIVR